MSWNFFFISSAIVVLSNFLESSSVKSAGIWVTFNAVISWMQLKRNVNTAIYPSFA